MITLTVILCTRDPHPGRLARTLAGLATQQLATERWELLIVDNGSTPPLSLTSLPPGPANLRIVTEPSPGLTPARLRGIAESRGEILVFVDDDNVLASGYLSSALDAFDASPRLGAAGGPVVPEFEVEPPDWAAEFFPLLALQNHGPAPLLATGGPSVPWPAFAPVGAGLCLSREHALVYAQAVLSTPARATLDRRAGSLASGGDNDMVFTVLRNGGEVAYRPELTLLHLIPSLRLEPAYLARLNRGIQQSWMRVLTVHRANPWPPLTALGARLRIIKSWLHHLPCLRGPAARIRWHGAVGHFEGRVSR
jgi:glycosyltransferase involved in cell wall biosynthesis